MRKKIKLCAVHVAVFVMWLPLLIPIVINDATERWLDSGTAERLFLAGQRLAERFGVKL